jgi:hypothetical protein
MKKDKAIIVFYLAYVIWLFVLIFLSPNTTLLTYFTGIILAFYLVFLSNFWDIAWLTAGIIVFLILTTVKINGFVITFDKLLLANIPLWVYLAWGTTIVSLRRFFIIASK